MPDVAQPENMNTAEALVRIVYALESIAESLSALEDVAVTLDVALAEFPSDSSRSNFSGFIRSYQQATKNLEEDGQENNDAS